MQSILTKFDFDWTLAKGIRICFLQENLWLFIKVKMDQQNYKLNNFNKMIEKPANAKTKAKFRPTFNIF